VAQEWFVKVGEQARGPVGAAKLKQYALEGRLKPDMLVRCGSEGPWLPAAKVKRLFPAAPPREEEDITAESPAPAAPPPSPSAAAADLPVVESGAVGANDPPDDRSAHLPAFSDDEPEENLLALVPAETGPVVDEVPEIVVEPKPLVPIKAKAKPKSKASRKGKGKRGEEEEAEEPAAAAKGKGKRRKRSRLSIQLVLGIAASVAIVGLSGVLAYVLWQKSPQETATKPPVPTSTTPTEPVSAVAMSYEELFDKTAPGVAFIEGRLSTGTGWIVAPNMLATNRHVIEGELMRHVKVHFPSAPETRQGPYKAKVVYVDNAVDLAFLEVETSTPPLVRGSNVEFRHGREIAVIGCPGVSPDLTIKNGIVKGNLSSQVVIDGNSYDQLSISINPGNSGGPVFDLMGRVIGVVTLKASQQEGIGFAIPMDEVDRLLERAQGQSNEQVAQMRARHRARVVVMYLEKTGEIYNSALETLLKVRKKGVGAEVAMPDVFKEHLAKVDKVLIGDLQKELVEIERDERLSEADRANIVELGKVYADIKQTIEEPEKDLDKLEERCDELGKKFDELVKSLAPLKGK
jgi:S1-C subfamily serine protease